MQHFRVTREQVDTLSNESVFAKEWNAGHGDAKPQRAVSSASLRRCNSALISKGRMSPSTHAEKKALREFRYCRNDLHQLQL